MPFVENGDDTWACFLVTFAGDDGSWHGYYSFRPDHGDVTEDEVRTADIFVEASETEIYDKARSLGSRFYTVSSSRRSTPAAATEGRRGASGAGSAAS